MNKRKNGSDRKSKENMEIEKGEMIRAECKDREQKEEIMKVKKEKLEGEEIYISHDRTWKERENERIMRTWLKSRKQEEKDIAKVRHKKVIIGETEWMLEEEEDRMKVLIPRKRKEDGGTGERRRERQRTRKERKSQKRDAVSDKKINRDSKAGKGRGE